MSLSTLEVSESSVPQKIGVICNTGAGAFRRGEVKIREIHDAAGRSQVEVFNSPESLTVALGRFQAAGVDTIAVTGGDGTVGVVLTEVMAHWRGQFPALAPLRGGSLNSTARCLGVADRPLTEQVFELTRAAGVRGGWQRALAQSLRVWDRDHATRYGFVFGSGLVFDYVKHIGELGGTTAWNSLAGVLTLTAQGLLNSPSTADVFGPHRAVVAIDGRRRRFEHFKTAVACGPVFLPGFARPMRGTPPKGRFSFLVNGMPKNRLFRGLWSVLRGRCQDAAHLVGHARDLKVDCERGYVLDGELFEQPKGGRVHVGAGPRIPLLVHDNCQSH